MEGFTQGFIFGFILAVIGGTIHYSVLTHITKKKLKKEYEWFFKGYEPPISNRYIHNH